MCIICLHTYMIIYVTHIWSILIKSYMCQAYDHMFDTYMIKGTPNHMYVNQVGLDHMCESYMWIIYVSNICDHMCASYTCQTYVIICVHHIRVKHMWSYVCIIYMYKSTWCRSKYSSCTNKMEGFNVVSLLDLIKESISTNYCKIKYYYLHNL